MKRFIVGFVAYFGIGLLACEDSTFDDKKVELSVVAHYKTIGEQITYETGMRWIDLYEKERASSGRVELFGKYAISETMTLQMMASVDDLVGVAFHHAKDAFGVKHIIAIPVGDDLLLWSNIPGRIYVDTNTGNAISKATASAWAQNYKNANPNGIWFHFFGADIFDDIIALPFFNSIDIQPALSDWLLPQMLLIIWNESFSFGRTEDEWGAVYDASSPCPPCQVE